MDLVITVLEDMLNTFRDRQSTEALVIILTSRSLLSRSCSQ
jgi:hypothetical protein